MIIKFPEKSSNTLTGTRPALQKQRERIRIVDVLRGFALFGILLIHSLQKFSNTTLASLGQSDTVADLIQGLIEFLVEDKFYIIFSFLFGWSFHAMYQNALERQKLFVKTYLLRLVILLVIGLLHSLFFKADILQVYAFIGLILVICRAFKSQRLLTLSVVLMALSVPCIYFQHLILEVISRVRQTGMLVPTKLTYNLLTGRIFITSAMFVFGLYLGKVNFFESLSNNQFRQRIILFRSGYIFLTVCLCLTLIKFYFVPSESGIVKLAQILCFVAQNASLSCLYVTMITLLYSQTLFVKPMEYLVALGRMGMSAYLMQSVFLVIFYDLTDGMNLDLIEAMGVTVLFFLGQIFFANIWMSYYKFGPVEWLWRKMTHVTENSRWFQL